MALTDLRLCYTGTTKSVNAKLIQTWTRGAIPAPVMSASGGPKELIRNQVYALLHDDKNKAIDTVTMVVARGVFFLLARKGKEYFDMTGKQVEVVVRNPPSGLGGKS